ncbi:MAG: alpha/beta hydrolase [Terricaulis sp.]|nr:alpha/beta hydrolase [Terricaulis sp.]
MTVFLDGPRLPPARGGKADALVILLHGYGSNGADLISLAPYWAEALPGASFVAPNAIEPLPEAPGGYQWFPITQLDPHLMEQGVRAAAPSVDRFIDAELEKHSLPPERCALVGFSQGTMMALHVGLRRSRPLAAILGFSGLLAGGARLEQEIASKPPVLLVHGDRDPTIAIPAMFDSAEALAEAGHGAQWHISYGVPHSIGPDGLELGGSFLASNFKRALA